MKPLKILKILLLAGALYFFLISLVHLFGIKIPGLYLYYSLSSYEYQDTIISFLAFGWALFMFSGFLSVRENMMWIPGLIILAGIFAIVLLGKINLSSEVSLMAGRRQLFTYWIELGILVIYLANVLTFYLLVVGKQFFKKSSG